MRGLYQDENQIRSVTNFEELISTPFQGDINAICWNRKLIGNFAEIINQIELTENIVEIELEELLEFKLSEQGELARKTLLNDFEMLKAQGAAPILNVIKNYNRDNNYPFFPTDVYSFHVDRSPVPTDTFLCTYYGESSEILPNSQAIQKILVPEIRAELKKLHKGSDKEFELFLSEHFFDLHYLAKPNARPISQVLGHFWRLAVDHPESKVLPCVHRAPKEKTGEYRLLMIC